MVMQFVRVLEVVGIVEFDEFIVGFGNFLIVCVGKVLVGLLDILKLVIVQELFGDLFGIVGRVVIYNDDFKVLIGLVLQ